ncbi:MAG TPA: tRNA pseudouridine(13) synthase TruD, partial [Phycisphaerales bacterium]|nr:tRNA pseudouridine(13) synthase TruD [Phycisphaerales bacterium]
ATSRVRRTRKDSGRTRVFTRLAASRWGDWKALASELPRCPERAPFEALAAGSDHRRAFSTLPAFLQSMYVEAFQSHLWNRSAHALAVTIAGGAERCLRSDDAYGEMLFPPWSASARGPWRSLILPLIGPGTTLEEPWANEVRATLARENLVIDQLRVPGLKRPFFGEAPRPLFAQAAGFAVSDTAPDTDSRSSRRYSRRLEFTLPRGSYATVVLRALGQ